MATGMANSLGVVEKNTYLLMNEEAISSGTYAKGANAVFPYVDIQESIPVIAFSSTYMKGSRLIISLSRTEVVLFTAKDWGLGDLRVYSVRI